MGPPHSLCAGGLHVSSTERELVGGALSSRSALCAHVQCQHWGLAGGSCLVPDLLTERKQSAPSLLHWLLGGGSPETTPLPYLAASSSSKTQHSPIPSSRLCLPQSPEGGPQPPSHPRTSTGLGSSCRSARPSPEYAAAGRCSRSPVGSAEMTPDFPHHLQGRGPVWLHRPETRRGPATPTSPP